METSQIKILLFDDHKITREGITELFKTQSSIEVVGGTGDSTRAEQLVCELKPNLVTIELNMSGTDNIELSRRIISGNDGIEIVALVAQLHVHILNQAIEAGVSGFVLKECGFAELVNAIHTVHEGRTHMCSKTKDIITRNCVKKLQAGSQVDASVLTEREHGVMRFLSEGMTSKEIALRMGISPKTVDACRRKLMHKLKIDSVAELVKHAIRVGITGI